MERAALRHRWPMNREHFDALSNEQMRIALGGEVVVKREFDGNGNVIRETRQNSSPKERTAAYKALVAADALNMEQEKRDLQIPDFVEHNHSGQVEQVVEIVQVADWFGRSPNAPATDEARPAAAEDDLPAASDAAPGGDPALGQPL